MSAFVGVRQALLLLTAVVGTVSFFAAYSAAAEIEIQPVFTHGVASGDVRSTEAVIWTRVDRESTLRAEVSASPDFETIAFEADVRAPANHDYTARTTARPLEPLTQYFYRFRSGKEASQVGTFWTAPSSDTPSDVRFAYSGDSDGTPVDLGEGPQPYFNNFEVFDRIREEDPAFSIYLGDTVYQDSGLRKAPAATLPEFRQSYKDNRRIQALPELLKAMPIYAQWDDHEVENDFAGLTVDQDLFGFGRQSFLEYMPIDTSRFIQDPNCAEEPLFRTVRYGADLEIFIPDERSCRSESAQSRCMIRLGKREVPDPGPTAPSSVRQLLALVIPGFPVEPAPACLAAMRNPQSTMLGTRQRDALIQALRTSSATFKVIASEVAFQEFYAYPYDRWEGYAAERATVLRAIADPERPVRNAVFLTTDNHATILNEVYVDGTRPPKERVTAGYEVITGPVATNTLEVEIRDLAGGLGQPPELVLGLFQAVVTQVAEADCHNLNKYSYGLVELDSKARRLTVTAKDDNGEPVRDQIDSTRLCRKRLP